MNVLTMKPVNIIVTISQGPSSVLVTRDMTDMASPTVQVFSQAKHLINLDKNLYTLKDFIKLVLTHQLNYRICICCFNSIFYYSRRCFEYFIGNVCKLNDK